MIGCLPMQALAFLAFSFTQRTQRKRLRLNGNWASDRRRVGKEGRGVNTTIKLESTHRVQTSANAVRYVKASPSRNVINIHQQLFQLVFNV